jgi:hypothetical protein
MRTKVLWFAVPLVLLAMGFSFYAESNRYSLVKGPDGELYKIDKRTGRTWKIIDYVAIEVKQNNLDGSKQTPEQEAIWLANLDGISPAGDPTVEGFANGMLRNLKGPLRVEGWNAKRLDDQTYMVSYVYDLGVPPNIRTAGWVFEVNLQAHIVRDVTNDPELLRADAVRLGIKLPLERAQ